MQVLPSLVDFLVLCWVTGHSGLWSEDSNNVNIAFARGGAHFPIAHTLRLLSTQELRFGLTKLKLRKIIFFGWWIFWWIKLSLQTQTWQEGHFFAYFLIFLTIVIFQGIKKGNVLYL